MLVAVQRAMGVAACTLLLLIVTTCNVDKLTNSQPPVATLAVAPGKLSQTAAVGSMALRLDSVALANAGDGGGPLSWSAGSMLGSAWLSLTPKNGATPAWLRVQLDPTGLTPGAYHDTVVVSAGNATHSPAAVPVDFVVHPCVAAAITPDALLTDSLTRQSCGAPHRAGSFAQLYSFTGRAGDSVSVLMAAPALDGYVVLDSSTAGTAPALAENDRCATSGDACLRYELLRVGGTYTIEATSAAAGATGAYTLSVSRPRAPAAPGSVAQLRSDSTTAVPLGSVTDEPTVVVRGVVTDPDIADTLRLQVEVQPVGTAFTDLPTAASDPVASGQPAVVALTGLADDAAYHWQARALDQTGRSSAWVPFGSNAETVADFVTAVPQPPAAPGALAQFQSDGVASIAVGGTAKGRSVVFKATATDPNAADQLRLDVEVEPLGTAFSGVPSGSGASVANGATATATVAGLNDNVSYHWQARAVDQTGRAGPWAAFGGNAETVSDFRVAVTVTQLAFTVPPSTTAAGAAITPAVQVTAQDALGATVVSFTGDVTVTLATNPAGGTLGGTTTLPAVNGVATFANLTIERVGQGYTLRASTGALSQTSAPFEITTAAAGKLAMVTQPSAAAQSGVAFSTQPAVQVQDPSGNPVADPNVVVTAVIASGPSGATLASASATTSSSGRATFSGLAISGPTGSYTLSFVASGLAPVSSNGITLAAGPASALAIVTQPSASVQSGSAFPQQPVLQLHDAAGNAVHRSGVAVTAALASGGPALSGANPIATNNSGTATFTNLTITGIAGARTLSFTAPQLGTVTSTTVTVTAGPATQIAINGGDKQTAPVGGTVPIQPSVIVKDGGGNPVGGVTVTFAVAPGSGSITGASQTTNASGIASVGSWTLGTTAGTNTLTATASGLTGSPVTFTATGTAGGAGSIALSAGDNQTATVNTAVATAPAVIVRDQFNNPVAGVAVVFAVGSGSGTSSITGADQTTNASGIATVGSWTLGRTTGGYTLTASSAGLTGSPVTFTATARAAAPASIAVSAGNNQSAPAGSAVPTPPAVVLRDQFDNPVAGVAVTFAVAAGGGSVNPTTPVTTGADGIAAVTSWTLGTTAGTNRLTATASGSGITGNPLSFTATGTAGAAARLAMATQPSGTVQSGVIFPQQPVVQLEDASGNPVSQSGTTVTAAIASGGGTLGGTATATTNSAGTAVFTNLSIIGTVGPRTLGFSATGFTGVTSATVDVTAGAATQIAVNAGDQQTATTGTAVAVPPSVIVKDASGNPVQGVAVTFAEAGGGGSITGANQITNASGIATVGSWTLGMTAGTNTLTATAPGLTGSPVTFTATGAPGAPAHLTKFSGDGLTGQVGTTLGTPHTVLVTDANSNPVPNVTVSWAAASGGGSVNPTTSQTDVNGHASTIRTLGATPGTQTTTAGAAGLTPVTFTITATVAGATQMTLNGGDRQTGVVGSTLPTTLSVRVADQFNNPVAGVQISWSVVDGGGSVNPAITTSNTSGIASTSWTLGTRMTPTDSTQVVQATGVGSPVNFTGFTVPGPVSASQTTVVASPATITASTGSSASTITVTARDPYGNVIRGKTVVLAATGTGNALVQPSPDTTIASGVASGTLSSTVAQGKTVSATVAGTAITQQATVTVSPAAAASLDFIVQPSNVAAGVAIAPPIQVEVRDQFQNRATAATPGIMLALNPNPGSATLGGTLPRTAVNGVATFDDITVDRAANGYQLVASSAPLTATTSALFNVTTAPATSIAINAGNNQTATVGTAVATPPSVLVRDQFNNPVAGVPVTFAAGPGGSTVSPTTPVTTNASGIAAVTSWTLGHTAGTNTLTASATGLTGSPVTFSASGTAGPATQIALNAGNSQTAPAGTAVATPPSVLVRDQFNNPVAGVAVTFAPASGSGTVNPTTPVTTDASGVAAVSSWTLGTTPGTNTLTATASGLSGSPVTFTATGTTGAATQIAIKGGNGQTATVATAVATPPSVIVRDQFNNPVAGVAVTFAVASGNGSVDPTTAVTTNGSGIAAVTSWTLGPSAGTNTLTATAPGLTGSPVTFTATGTAGSASSIALHAGDNQSAPAGTAVATPPAALVRDQHGNPVQGVSVTFAVASGGGSVNPTSPVATGLDGIAAATSWTLGPTEGTNTLTASSAGLTGSPVTFTATGTPGAAARLALTTPPSSTAQNGVPFAQQPVLQVQDANGNPINQSGTTVTASIASGPSGATLGNATATTGSNGAASFSGLRLSGTAGSYTLRFEASGLATATSGTISLSAGAVASLGVNGGNNQTATAGTAVATPPSVLARDASGNPVAGVSVTFAVATGGGSVEPTAPVVTGANGVAAATSWTLGATAGSNTLTATAAGSGISGNPVTFTATGTAGAAARLSISTEPSSTAQSGVSLAQQPVIQLRDANGNPVSQVGVSVTVAIASGPSGSTLGGTTSATTNATGTASFSDVAIAGPVGSYTLGFSATGFTGVASGAIAVSAGPAAAIAVDAGNDQSAPAGSAVATPPSVIVRDASGNPVAGISVTFAVASGGGSVNPTSPVPTGANGVAAATSWTLGSAAGANTLTAAAAGSGISGNPVTFTATGTAGAAARLSITTQPSSAGQSGAPLAQQPVLQLQDAGGNPVGEAGVVVTATVASGPAGAALANASATTNASGVASFGGLTLTGTVGSYTLSFGASPLTPATSGTITLSAGAAATIAVGAGNDQSAVAGTAVAIPPAAVVKDASGNPVSGVSVSFAVATGNGTVDPTTPVITGTDGVAAVRSWTLGPTAGANTLTATAPGLTGSPVTFTATATVGAPASLTKSSGDNLSGQVGSTLATPHEVLVTDARGNPVSGVRVDWQAATGGGSVNPTSSTTDVNGHATTTRTLGVVPGTQTTTATATLSGGPATVTFTITATIAGASRMTKTGGDLQKDTVGATLPVPLSVKVTDDFNNPVANVTVSWTVIDGGGSVAPTTVSTDANGLASTQWTLGTRMTATDSTQAVQATGVGSPLNFLATSRPGAVSASRTTVTASQSTISASSGGSAATITVTALDGFGNPIGGKTVTLTATGNGNTLTQPAGPTNTSGVASGTLSSTVAEAKTVSATVGGTAIAQQATVTVNPATAAKLVFLVPPGNATAGAVITPPPEVEIRDQFDNRVSSATNGVTMALGANPAGAILSGVGPVAAVSGVATFSNLSVDRAGTGYTLVASASGLSPATSTAFNVAAGAVSAAQSSVTAAPVTVAAGQTTTITVTARDAAGDPVSGATVVLAATGDGNNLSQPAAATNGSGVATGTLSSTRAETKTVSATINGIGITQTASVTVTAGPAAEIAVNAGNNQSATVGTAVATPPAVIVHDASGNPVAGLAVTFHVASGSGTADPTTPVTTNGSGIAALTSWTLGPTAGTNTLTATAAGSGISGNPVTFTADGTAGAAGRVAFTTAPSGTAQNGVALAQQPVLQLEDANGNPVSQSGVVVTATVSPAGATP
ncbi:MAG: hypothetical protein DMD69_03370, partial [Gemmatimonadetes bacterium]